MARASTPNIELDEYKRNLLYSTFDEVDSNDMRTSIQLYKTKSLPRPDVQLGVKQSAGHVWMQISLS